MCDGTVYCYDSNAETLYIETYFILATYLLYIVVDRWSIFKSITFLCDVMYSNSNENQTWGSIARHSDEFTMVYHNIISHVISFRATLSCRNILIGQPWLSMPWFVASHRRYNCRHKCDFGANFHYLSYAFIEWGRCKCEKVFGKLILIVRKSLHLVLIGVN